MQFVLISRLSRGPKAAMLHAGLMCSAAVVHTTLCLAGLHLVTRYHASTMLALGTLAGTFPTWPGAEAAGAASYWRCGHSAQLLCLMHSGFTLQSRGISSRSFTTFCSRLYHGLDSLALACAAPYTPEIQRNLALLFQHSAERLFRPSPTNSKASGKRPKDFKPQSHGVQHD